MRADGCENAGLAGNDAKKQINRNSVFFILFLSVVLLIYKGKNPQVPKRNRIDFAFISLLLPEGLLGGGTEPIWAVVGSGGRLLRRSRASVLKGIILKKKSFLLFLRCGFVVKK